MMSDPEQPRDPQDAPASPPPYDPAAQPAAPPPYHPAPSVVPAGGEAPRGQPPIPQTWAQAPLQPGWDPQTAVTESPRRRRGGLWLGLGLGAAGLVIVAGVIAAVLFYLNAQAEERLAEAREVSYAEQGVIRTAVDDASESASGVIDATTAYRAAADAWSQSEAAAAQFTSENTAPQLQVSNPGGTLPGGDADERAFLQSIGAGDVQIILDAGDQNCGYKPGGAGWIAVGGCYNPSFRSWLFLAWDPGTTNDALWAIFVHEAMHWQQWDKYAVLYESASRAGVDADQYRHAVESDASCRAVYLHGVPISAYVGSSSPCDVDGWTESYLPDYLASLGVPVAAPDPEAFEVLQVVRP